jgi:hypothetical protein
LPTSSARRESSSRFRAKEREVLKARQDPVDGLTDHRPDAIKDLAQCDSQSSQGRLERGLTSDREETRQDAVERLPKALEETSRDLCGKNRPGLTKIARCRSKGLADQPSGDGSHLQLLVQKIGQPVLLTRSQNLLRVIPSAFAVCVS